MLWKSMSIINTRVIPLNDLTVKNTAVSSWKQSECRNSEKAETNKQTNKSLNFSHTADLGLWEYPLTTTQIIKSCVCGHIDKTSMHKLHTLAAGTWWLVCLPWPFMLPVSFLKVSNPVKGSSSASVEDTGRSELGLEGSMAFCNPLHGIGFSTAGTTVTLSCTV